MIYVVIRDKGIIKRFFYKDAMLKKWEKIAKFLKDKTLIELFKSDTLTIEDFKKVRYWI